MDSCEEKASSHPETQKKEEPNPKKIKLNEESNMETLPDEILLKIFSYFEVQDLIGCAAVSKRFQKIAYEKSLWQKLPIPNLRLKRVPAEFFQKAVERGISSLNLDCLEIIEPPEITNTEKLQELHKLRLCLESSNASEEVLNAVSILEKFFTKEKMHFAQPNCVRYLKLGFLSYQNKGKEVKEMKKSLLSSCTQLEKFECHFDASEVDDISQCIRQNSESLKCVEINCCMYKVGPNDMSFLKLATAISKCKQSEKLSLSLGSPSNYNLCQYLPQNLRKLNLGDRCLKFDDLKILVERCSKLEELFFEITLCCLPFTFDFYHQAKGYPCRHFDKAISIIAGSSLCRTLVHLEMRMDMIHVHKQFDATILKLGQMKKLKTIELSDSFFEDSPVPKAYQIIKKLLPHLIISENPEPDFLNE